jgi:hypothetical protein
LVDAFALHDANALNGLRGRAAELNQQQPKDRSCTTDPTATRHRHSSPGSESVSNLAQERSEFGIVLRVRRTTIRDRKAQELNVTLAQSCAQVLRPGRWRHIVNEASNLAVFVQEHERVDAVLVAESLSVKPCAARVQHP